MKNTIVSSLLILAFLAQLCAAQTTTTTTTPSGSDPAKEIMDRINEVVCTVLTILVYISAGLAALMIMFAGVKYLTAGDDVEARTGAKNIIVYALAGMVAVFLACPFVDYIVTDTGITPFSKSCNCLGGGMSNPPGGTTTTTIGSGGTTTTTIAATPMLTAQAVADCINLKSGALEIPSAGCPACTIQGTIFTSEAGGTAAYNSIANKIDTTTSSCPDPAGGTIVPCWTWGTSTLAGCNTLNELNIFYNCGLAKDPSHSYATC